MEDIFISLHSNPDKMKSRKLNTFSSLAIHVNVQIVSIVIETFSPLPIPVKERIIRGEQGLIFHYQNQCSNHKRWTPFNLGPSKREFGSKKMKIISLLSIKTKDQIKKDGYFYAFTTGAEKMGCHCTFLSRTRSRKMKIISSLPI